MLEEKKRSNTRLIQAIASYEKHFVVVNEYIIDTMKSLRELNKQIGVLNIAYNNEMRHMEKIKSEERTAKVELKDLEGKLLLAGESDNKKVKDINKAEALAQAVGFKQLKMDSLAKSIKESQNRLDKIKNSIISSTDAANTFDKELLDALNNHLRDAHTYLVDVIPEKTLNEFRKADSAEVQKLLKLRNKVRAQLLSDVYHILQGDTSSMKLTSNNTTTTNTTTTTSTTTSTITPPPSPKLSTMPQVPPRPKNTIQQTFEIYNAGKPALNLPNVPNAPAFKTTPIQTFALNKSGLLAGTGLNNPFKQSDTILGPISTDTNNVIS